jgi:uncharacterized protein (TIGR02265 family)
VFVEPDWSRSIDFEAYLAAIPADASVRGMFLPALIQSLGPDAPPPMRARRYVPFKNYPIREYVELMAQCCHRPTLGIAPAERVRRLGHGIYRSYASTITGTAIFAAAGGSFRRVLELCPSAFHLAASHCKVTVRELGEGRGVLELRRLWLVPDLHGVGIVEGALEVCNARGQVRVQKLGLADVDLEITWTNDAG